VAGWDLLLQGLSCGCSADVYMMFAAFFRVYIPEYKKTWMIACHNPRTISQFRVPVPRPGQGSEIPVHCTLRLSILEITIHVISGLHI
jgi:hypothetical protein